MCRSMVKWTLLGVMVLTMLALPLTVLAAGQSGGSGEPGGSCAESYDYKYDPPPYKGTINVTYDPNTWLVTFSGTLEKAGNSGCVAILNNVIWEGYLTPDEWLNLTAQDFNGLCLTQINAYFPCEGAGYIEILGAHKLIKEGNAGSFEAIAMHLIWN